MPVLPKLVKALRVEAHTVAPTMLPRLVMGTRIGAHTVAPTAAPRLSVGTRVAAHSVAPAVPLRRRMGIRVEAHSVVPASPRRRSVGIRVEPHTVDPNPDYVEVTPRTRAVHEELEQMLADSRRAVLECDERIDLLIKANIELTGQLRKALAELDTSRARITVLEEASRGATTATPAAPRLHVGGTRVEAHTVPPAPVAPVQPAAAGGTPAVVHTRRPRRRQRPPAATGQPIAIASVAALAPGPPPRRQDAPVPPFVAVLRRHSGLCRNFAFHGVCGLPGCTRRHEVVSPTIEGDLRRALRDKWLYSRHASPPYGNPAPPCAPFRARVTGVGGGPATHPPRPHAACPGRWRPRFTTS